jgi:transcription termination factor Rho
MALEATDEVELSSARVCEDYSCVAIYPSVDWVLSHTRMEVGLVYLHHIMGTLLIREVLTPPQFVSHVKAFNLLSSLIKNDILMSSA